MSLKSEVLKILEDNRGQNISGEELALSLNVSRNSIWKAINNLRNDGHMITAVTNRGYSLSKDNDILSSEGILSYLDKTNFSGDIYTFKTIDSTNSYAKKLALEGAKHSTVIIAEEQSAGRGRLGRTFYSPSRTGIYMSIILRPNLNISDSVLITTASSVAICRAIKKVTNIDTKIKWINDIILNNKKVGGILTEAVTDFESGTIEHIILGIGLNFNTSEVSFPPEIKDLATSLYTNTPNTISRNQLCAEIISEILKLLPNLKEREFINDYKSHSVVINKNIKFIIGKIEDHGTVLDITNDGALIVKKDDGTIITLNSGEITIRS